MTHETQSKPRKSKFLNTLIKLVLCLAVLAVIVFASFHYLLNKTLDKPINIQSSYLLTIQPATSFHKFSKQMVQLKWLDHRLWLLGYGKLYPSMVSIKAGTYKIEPKSNLRAVLNKVVSGQEHQFSITFIEGSTFKEAIGVISSQENITHTLQGKSIKQISALIDLEKDNPEGLLFPDTYAYRAGTTDIEILKRANAKLNKELEALWKTRAKGLPYKNAYEALIMASIIEKETGHVPEQPLISSVFVNRLQKRMRLQTDPTIIYGLGERYTGDITYANMREKTAYNTYRINGLPPTPIALAGLSAIKATLNPIKSDYYYFVSQGNGKHTFSKTLKEHNKAVRAYLALPQN
ncbi:MAG: endolytic transglycosylase MltG [Colwellia sp.]